MSYKLIISAVMVVIFFTSVITARMSYYKRLPEFGVMKAIGSTQVDLLKMVVYEALFLGVFSIILGFLVSLAIKMLVDTVGGIPMPNPPGANYDLTVGIKLNSTILTMAASIALLVPLTASLLSYISFARLSVVDLIYNTHNDL